MEKNIGQKANPLLEKLDTFKRLNVRPDWSNQKVYRLLYSEDLFTNAYERVKSHPGMMTPGSDGETLDGMSIKLIRRIIAMLKNESYQPRPVRVEYIPKANGKLRRLGIPSAKDKLVQEAVRMILESIYDSPYGPTFKESSHGFRPTRSPHSALKSVQEKWSATSWIIEGDIEDCFGSIDHDILVNLLRKRTNDERFLNLIRTLLRAGYMDIKNGERGETLSGAPQGGIVSPILANIYMHELDEFIEQLKLKYEKGEERGRNPEYRRIAKRRETLAKRGKSKSNEFKRLSKMMRSTPSVIVDDPNWVRIEYIRFADDWIIGLCGPKKLAVTLMEEVRDFLKNTLGLKLSTEKTKITNCRTEEAFFLGLRLMIGRHVGDQKQKTSTNRSNRLFKRRSTGWEVVMKAPTDRVIKRLESKGFCNAEGKPQAKSGWQYLDDDQIISLFASVNRGIVNYYGFVDNYAKLSRIQYILHYSLVKTLASKYRTTLRKIFRLYGKDVTRLVEASDLKGKRRVSFNRETSWKKHRKAFHAGSPNSRIDELRLSYSLRTRSKLGWPCCICGETDDIEMHHVRHIKKMTHKKKLEGFIALMRKLNRKQVPVCTKCHQKIHQGRHDGLKLRDMAYIPR